MTAPIFLALAFEHSGQMSEDVHQLIEMLACCRGKHLTPTDRANGLTQSQVSASFRAVAKNAVAICNAQGFARQMQSTRYLPRDAWRRTSAVTIEENAENRQWGNKEADSEADRVQMGLATKASWVAQDYAKLALHEEERRQKRTTAASGRSRRNTVPVVLGTPRTIRQGVYTGSRLSPRAVVFTPGQDSDGRSRVETGRDEVRGGYTTARAPGTGQGARQDGGPRGTGVNFRLWASSAPCCSRTGRKPSCV